MSSGQSTYIVNVFVTDFFASAIASVIAVRNLFICIMSCSRMESNKYMVDPAV